MIDKKRLLLAGSEKLADILLELYACKDECREFLDITFARLESDPQKLAMTTKKRLASIKHSDRFLDYGASSDFSDQINQLRLSIAKDIQKNSPSTSLELMLQLLNIHENVLNRADDSSGMIGDVFTQAVEDLGILLKSSGVSPQKGADLVFERFMDNPFGIYDSLIIHTKEALKEEGLSLLKGKFQKCNNEKEAHRGLLTIADAQENVDAYIEACSFRQTPSEYDFLEIAKRLLKHQRPKQALSFLEKITVSHWGNQKSEMTIQALDMLGLNGKALKIRVEAFKKSLCSSLYKEILSLSDEGFQKQFKQETLDIVLQSKDTCSALSFLCDLKELEKAGAYVCENSDRLSGSLYFILRPIAKSLQKINPLAASLVYRKLADDVLDRATSKYYPYAAKDIVSCFLLKDQIDDWKQFPSHEDYLQELETDHKRKSRFWEELSQAKQRKKLQ